MAKTNANAPAAPAGPWRSGRPSFKAFYPEIILLTIVTIAFIALAARLSCSGAKPKSENAEPTPVSSATLFLTEQAFAQDASLDAAAPTAEETPALQAAEEAETAEAVEASTAAPSEEAETVESEEAETVETGEVGEASASTAAPNEETDAAAAPETQKSAASARTRTLATWIVCLAIPALLWIWRAFVWLTSVYGVFYEIRTDADNPKATTILVRRGILNKKTDSMHIAQVKDIQSSQSLWQKYFQGGVGTIRLFTKDLTDGVLTMKNMEEPSRVFNALDELRRRYWALGGVGGLNGQSGSGVEADEFDDVNDVAM